MEYSIDDVIKYISGEMSRDEMYELEKESLKDPFLHLALEGYRKVKPEDLKKLEENRKPLPKYVPNQNSLSRPTTNNRLIVAANNRTWLRVAAIFILILGAGVLSFYFLNQNTKQTITNMLLTKHGSLRGTNDLYVGDFKGDGKDILIPQIKKGY